jgi:hypothetical protein
LAQRDVERKAVQHERTTQQGIFDLQGPVALRILAVQQAKRLNASNVLDAGSLAPPTRSDAASSNVTDILKLPGSY